MTEIDSRIQEITITRTIHTSPTQVYVAFTSSQGWCEWCCETAEIDVRIGGKLHIYSEGYNAYGEFTVLEHDKAIAFTWDGDKEPPTQIRVLLGGQGDNTLMTFKVVVLGSEHGRADFPQFLERIWGHALDNPENVLEQKS